MFLLDNCNAHPYKNGLISRDKILPRYCITSEHNKHFITTRSKYSLSFQNKLSPRLINQVNFKGWSKALLHLFKNITINDAMFFAVAAWSKITSNVQAKCWLKGLKSVFIRKIRRGKQRTMECTLKYKVSQKRKI